MKPYKRQSERKKLRDKMGRLHLEILRLKRGNRDELTGRVVNIKELGRFHILTVASQPRLEFHEENILLTVWYGSHDDWHHDFYKAREMEKRIKKLRGEDYEIRLKAVARMQPHMNMFQLELIYLALQQELKALKKGG